MAYSIVTVARNRQRKPFKELPKREQRRLLTKFRAVILFLLGVSGLSVIGLWPRLTVDPGGQIDPITLSPIQFTITNTGFLSLSNVRPMLGICQLGFGRPLDSSFRCESPIPSKLVPRAWFARTLARDERHTIRLDDLFNVNPSLPFTGADISIAFSLDLWFIPRPTKEFRFVTRLERDGKFSWIQRPLDK